jgi:ribosomal protein S12 methylthiotransferase
LHKLIPEVTLFLPVLTPEKLAQEIMQTVPPTTVKDYDAHPQKIVFTPPSYAYIKVADGCMNLCTYCTIPIIRGPLTSLPIEHIVRNVKQKLEKGAVEINLVAQDTTSYGIDLYKKPSLVQLIKKLMLLKDDFWLRLLYLHPARINRQLLTVMASDPRIVKYIDMPIQHVSSRLLKYMKRPYTEKLLRENIDLIRNILPTAAIRTTMIVGFPTESGKDFQKLVHFVRDVQFDHLGVFEYSPEEDTPAFSLKPRVPVRTKRKRRKIVMEAQKGIVRGKNEMMVGRTLPCIVDLPVDLHHGIWTGRIYSQAPEVDGLVVISGYEQSMGMLPRVRITDFDDYDLAGECVK